MSQRIPKTVDALTGMFALTTITCAVMSLVSTYSFIIQPEGNIDPIQAWTIPALTVLYTALTIWSYKHDKKQQLAKVSTAKRTAPTDGRLSRTKAKRLKNRTN